MDNHKPYSFLLNDWSSETRVEQENKKYFVLSWKAVNVTGPAGGPVKGNTHTPLVRAIRRDVLGQADKWSRKNGEGRIREINYDRPPGRLKNAFLAPKLSL